jgi:hypothetical protein
MRRARANQHKSSCSDQLVPLLATVLGAVLILMLALDYRFVLHRNLPPGDQLIYDWLLAHQINSLDALRYTTLLKSSGHEDPHLLECFPAETLAAIGFKQGHIELVRSNAEECNHEPPPKDERIKKCEQQTAELEEQIEKLGRQQRDLLAQGAVIAKCLPTPLPTHQPTAAARVNAPVRGRLAHSCHRPKGWCKEKGMRYKHVDCDNDRVLDHACSMGGMRGSIRSSTWSKTGASCEPTWALDTPLLECPAAKWSAPPTPAPTSDIVQTNGHPPPEAPAVSIVAGEPWQQQTGWATKEECTPVYCPQHVETRCCNGWQIECIAQMPEVETLPAYMLEAPKPTSCPQGRIYPISFGIPAQNLAVSTVERTAK